MQDLILAPNYNCLAGDIRGVYVLTAARLILCEMVHNVDWVCGLGIFIMSNIGDINGFMKPEPQTDHWIRGGPKGMRSFRCQIRTCSSGDGLNIKCYFDLESVHAPDMDDAKISALALVAEKRGGIVGEWEPQDVGEFAKLEDGSELVVFYDLLSRFI